MSTTADTFTWKPEYELGIAEIDAQHKVLLTTTGELHHALESGAPEGEVLTHIEKILTLKAEHFATEERRFHEFNFEGTEEHEKFHQDFSTRVVKMREECGTDTKLFGAKLVDFLTHWFVGHLKGVDSKYVACFHEHGL
jgi:hemerythrin-like metal-binding protein